MDASFKKKIEEVRTELQERIETKLPLWAQNHIELLETRIKVMQEAQEKLKIQDSPIQATVGSMRSGASIPIPESAIVKFKIDQRLDWGFGNELTIHYHKRSHFDDFPLIRVSCNGLKILPSASNCIYIEGEISELRKKDK